MTTEPTLPPGFRRRLATAHDTEGIQNLIAICYAEYGYPFNPSDPEEEHTRAPHTYFAERGGAFWVTLRDDTLAATAALLPRGDTAELKSLYIHPSQRRCGLARALTAAAMSHARSLGCTRFIAWSDELFIPAHRLYLALGMAPTGVRVINAATPYVEHGFTIGLDSAHTITP